MLPVRVAKQSYSEFHTGQGTAGAAKAALTANAWEAKHGVFVRNHDGANSVYVGDSDVTVNTGFQLAAGDDIWIPVIAASDLYVITGGASVDYSFLVV